MFDKYYSILELTNNASNEEIKKAYRKMALMYHPDKQNGKSDTEQTEAEVKFKEVAEAYEILTNKEKWRTCPNYKFATHHLGSVGQFDHAGYNNLAHPSVFSQLHITDKFRQRSS